MCRGAACFLILVLLLASTTTVVWAQSSGVIEGQVLNASLDDAYVQGVPVTLWATDAEEQSILLQQVSDAEGRFRFKDLDTDVYSYQLQATYQGVSYWSDSLALPADQSLLSVPITVYETTESDADLRLERAHLIINPRPGVIQVQELQIFVNGGNQTYVGPGGVGGQTLQFGLPVGAAEVQLTQALMDCCIEETTEGFAYTSPILPGAQEFFFSYELNSQSANYTLRKGLTYPVHYLDVFVTDNGVEANGPRLTALEPISLQGQRYLHLSTEDLSKGDTLELSLVGLPLGSEPGTPGNTISPLLARMVMGVGTLLVILALAQPFFQNRESEAS